MSKYLVSLSLLLVASLASCRSTPASGTPSSPQPEPQVVESKPEPEAELQAQSSGLLGHLKPQPVQAAPLPPWQAEGVRTAFSRAGTYLLKWRSVGGEVPKNKHFEIDLWLFKPGDELVPFGGATIATRGWMPDHGHGMVRQPRSRQLEEGHYRISGMLLHMGGLWQLFFDVVVDGQAESTQFDLTL